MEWLGGSVGNLIQCLQRRKLFNLTKGSLLIRATFREAIGIEDVSPSPTETPDHRSKRSFDEAFGEDDVEAGESTIISML
jgi:hypothetical protein